MVPNILPIITLVGIPGAGKSTAAAIFEDKFRVKRLPRYTNRTPRRDDKAALIHQLSVCSKNPADFIYGGWGKDFYCLLGEDAIKITSTGNTCVVELGCHIDAKAAIDWAKGGTIVWIDRGFMPSRILSLFHEREMTDSAITERLATLESDYHALENAEGLMDFRVRNCEDVMGLTTRIVELGDKIGLIRR